MADGARLSLPTRIARLPWWAQVLAIFAASRVVTTTILLVFAALQPANPWTAASPDYLSFAKIWDGHWYYIIAVVGYPTELPLDAAGFVGENAWAFLPAYPGVIRLLMLLTGLPFELLAVAVSVAFAAGAALVFNRLMHRVIPESALFATVLFCVAPLSPILQVAYAESMQLFLLFAALLLPLERRLVVAGLASAVFGFAWLGIAALVTGSPSAYLDTELAWRVVYVGRDHLVPFQPWFQAADWWLRWNGVPGSAAGWLGAILLLLLIAAFAIFLLTPAARRLGVDLRLWLVSYVAYLLAVFFPQSSVFRLLMPLAPGLGALALPRSRVYRILLVLVFIALQVGWTYIGWWVDGADWTPP
mgnify:CR=1 FL=1